MTNLLQHWRIEFYSSVQFWIALVVVAALFRRFGTTRRAREVLLLASSNALLLAIPRFGPIDLLVVWVIAALAFGFCRALQRPAEGAGRRRAWTATAGVVTVLAFLAFYKYRLIQDVVLGPSHYLFLIGISYFTFKAIHLVVESYKRPIPDLDSLTFIVYMTFFPSFVSGPINRYDEFAAQLRQGSSGALGADLKAGGERIVHGLFKKLVLVPVVLPYALSSRAATISQASGLEIVTALYASALYFYFDFSGYSDLAIGGARVIGLTLPENFKHPFLQRNIRELWSSWHISLTSWLVDYVYWPVVRRLRNFQYFRARPVLLSVVGMNLTFLACGIWHGDSLKFVLWGAYHGVGISVLNVYQRQKRRIPSPWLQRYFNSTASRVAGAVVTFNFFAAGLALFVLDLGQLRELLSAALR